MKTKLAIVGAANSCSQAPYNDKSWDIWGLNHYFNRVPRKTKWFDLHDLKDYPEAHLSILSRFKDNLIIAKEDERLPEATVYPYNQVCKMIGGKHLCSSVAYMLALAIMQGYTTIKFFGITLQQPDEIRTEQRANLRELVFFARGRGINVSFHDGNIMKARPIYGDFN